MNKKARRRVFLASLAATHAAPMREFDADGVTRMHGCHSIPEVLRCISEGGLEWTNRWVTIWFEGRASPAWISVYPLQNEDRPYFDVMYTQQEPPQVVLSEFLERWPQCKVIDWSPGRSACIGVLDADIRKLAEIIQGVTQAAWGDGFTIAGVSYEEFGRA